MFGFLIGGILSVSHRYDRQEFDFAQFFKPSHPKLVSASSDACQENFKRFLDRGSYQFINNSKTNIFQMINVVRI